MTGAVRCYVGLGSNLDAPRRQMESAAAALARLPRTALVAVSPFYGNAALTAGQPDYVNAVAALESELSPHELLRALQTIEQAHGRQRGERWAARTLDLDLLLHGSTLLDTPELTLPHPRMLERAFVLRPLADLAPQLVLPDGSSLQRRLDCCPDHALTRLP